MKTQAANLTQSADSMNTVLGKDPYTGHQFISDDRRMPALKLKKRDGSFVYDQITNSARTEAESLWISC